MRPTEPTTHAQVAAAKTLVYVAATKPTHVATAEAARVTAAEAAAHVTGAKSSTAARVGGIGAEATAQCRGRQQHDHEFA
jgi:hypothetical protein